jgi:hypothetical protein
MALVGASFLLDVENAADVRAHFEQVCALASTIPIYALDYPREFGVLEEIRRGVLDQVDPRAAMT